MQVAITRLDTQNLKPQLLQKFRLRFTHIFGIKLSPIYQSFYANIILLGVSLIWWCQFNSSLYILAVSNIWTRFDQHATCKLSGQESIACLPVKAQALMRGCLVRRKQQLLHWEEGGMYALMAIQVIKSPDSNRSIGWGSKSSSWKTVSGQRRENPQYK